MDTLTMPLSREASAASAAVGDAVKKAGHHHHWGHHHWGHHHWGHCRCGIWAAGAFVGLPVFAGYLNEKYSQHKFKEDKWLSSLRMPSWTAPQPLFAPMWNFCYASMGLASMLVWKHGGGFHGKAQGPLMLYGGQLALSYCWIPLAYGAHSLKMASVTSVGTAVLATAATIKFHSILPQAAYIMLPYLAWLYYETALTLSMLNLNNEENQD